ncbi:MAG: DUF4340 domain-containing protein [Proteobacteria bacterium]|nr:DUF4340 domain-containing protein [Pseudomonadota bacterium]
MKKSSSSTLILLLALVVITGWYVFYEKRFKEEHSKTEERAKLLVPFSKDDIQELWISHRKGDTFQLHKTGSTWTITSPVHDDADNGVLGSLLSSLTSTQIEREIEDNPKDLGLFGLAEPSLTITAKKDENQSESILIGNATQVGSGSYVKLARRNTVFKVNRSLHSTFEKSLFELRNKKVLPLTKDEIKDVEIHNPTGSFLVNKEPSGKWFLAREGTPVDPNKWGKVLSSLTELRATSVESETGDSLKTFGLHQPVIKLFFTTEKGQQKFVLFLSTLKDKTYAKREDKALVYQVDKAILTELLKPANELRDPHPIAFNRFNVVRIKITRSDKAPVEIKKDGIAWGFTDPANSERVDTSLVEKFLTRLQDVQIARHLGPKTQPPRTPSLSIELFELKDNQEVSAGRLDFGKLAKGEITGTSSFAPLAWTLKDADFKEINLERKDFLEKQGSHTQEIPDENKHSEQPS